MNKNLYLIIGQRALLSFSYGILNVIISIHLHDMGFSTLKIGEILGSAILISAVLSFILAMFADHYGRKYVLTALFGAFSISVFAFFNTNNPILLSIFAGLGSFTGSGGGPIGSGGPFGAIQTALITEFNEGKNFVKNLSWASSIGILSTALGSLSLTLIGDYDSKFNILLYVMISFGLISLLISLAIKDNGLRSKKLIPVNSWKNIIKLSIPTIPGGIGGGMILPIFSLWFHLKYGLSVSTIGIIFFMSNIFVIITMLIFAYSNFSQIKTIIYTRLASSLGLIILALSPFVILTVALFILRNSLQMGAIPVRQSFSMGIVHESERASTSGATSMVRTGFTSVSPPFAGEIMPINIDLPPIVGGIISLLDPILYYKLFAKEFKKRENN